MVRTQERKTTDQLLRIIEAPATIIREDIRLVVNIPYASPSPNQMFDNMNENIPKIYSDFIEKFISTNQKGYIKKLKTYFCFGNIDPKQWVWYMKNNVLELLAS